MSYQSRGELLGAYVIGKNLAQAKAFETNIDFQKLLVNLYARAEQFAAMKNTTLDKITVKGDILANPSLNRISWEFGIQE